MAAYRIETRFLAFAAAAGRTFASGDKTLERFRAKWTSLCVKKMRQIKKDRGTCARPLMTDALQGSLAGRPQALGLPGALTKAMRSMLVAPGEPKGTPATISTRSAWLA